MIRVLHVLVRVRPGGSLTLVRERIQRLDPQEVQSHVCALLPIPADALAMEAIDEWQARGIPVTVLDHRARNDAFRTLSSLSELIRTVNIVHTVNATETYIAIATRLAGRPLVRDLISTVPPSRLSRLVARTATVNLAISHSVAEVHAAPRTRVLYPPIELGSMPQSALRPTYEDQKPTVLIVARFAPGKGLHLLPPIVEALIRRVPNVNVVIAGDGQGRKQLEADLEALEASQHVTMLGFRTDISALHAAADVYLSTSEAEGLVGYATLEAAVAGTPIVASPIPAVTEVLRDGEDALLVDPRSPEAVAEAITKILRSRHLGESLAISARHRIEQLLDPSAAIVGLTALYREIYSPRKNDV